LVILIGGASCSGKTTMAQKLMEEYRITYMSIDHVKMGIVRGSKYCDFSAEDPEDEVTEKLWPIVEGIIKTNIENDQHIIMEGCYLPTDKVVTFDKEYIDYIVPLYLCFSQPYIEKHYADGIIAHRSETEYKNIDSYMIKENFIRAHKNQKERCIRDGLIYFEVSEDYNQDLRSAYDWIKTMIDRKKSLRYN
jgi:adenylate kinase family enzyme